MLPTLHTDRLILQPSAAEDLPALWRLWTDPDVRRFLWDDRTISLDEARTTLHECGDLAAQGLGLWTLRTREPRTGDAADDRDALGCAGLLPVSTAAEYDERLVGMIEPLVALSPRAWGRGFAIEALAALLHYARSTLHLDQLAAVTDVPNVASDRMLQRSGFTVLGEVPGPRHRLRTYRWSATGDAT